MSSGPTSAKHARVSAVFQDQELLREGVDPQVLASPNYVKKVADIPGIELFDNAFFGFTPRDAEIMTRDCDCCSNALGPRYNGNLLVENRHGLIVNTQVFEANGTAERDAALVMLEQIPGTKPVTVGGDKAYDTADFVAECRNLKVTPHVAQNLERPGGSAIDARTTQHAGYAISQRKRKRVEECFGWLKTIALLRKVRHRGIYKVG